MIISPYFEELLKKDKFSKSHLISISLRNIKQSYKAADFADIGHSSCCLVKPGEIIVTSYVLDIS